MREYRKNISDKRSVASAFVSALMLLALIAVTVLPISAADKTCAMKIVCTYDSSPVENLEWSVYRIGSRNSFGGFSLEGDFKDYPVSLDDMSASAIQKDAYTLENYAILDDIAATASGITDKQGKTTLNNLEAGIYLISGKEYSDSKYRYTPVPSIIELGGNSESNITVYPKFSAEKIPDTKKTSYSVKKVWVNDEEASGPTEITVELYADEKLYKTIKLNSSNGWKYQWESDSDISWRVKETTSLKNYSVTVGKDSTEFLIVNTYNPPSSSVTTTTKRTTTTTAKTKKTTTATSKKKTTTATVTTVTTTPRDELEKKIKEYEKLHEDDYTPKSWKRFEQVLERVKKVLSYIDSTDEEIQAALDELEDAKNNLVSLYDESLPQTGQLWWPVPVLAGGGVVLIAIGIRIMIKKGRRNEEE